MRLLLEFRLFGDWINLPIPMCSLDLVMHKYWKTPFEFPEAKRRFLPSLGMSCINKDILPSQIEARLHLELPSVRTIAVELIRVRLLKSCPESTENANNRGIESKNLISKTFFSPYPQRGTRFLHELFSIPSFEVGWTPHWSTESPFVATYTGPLTFTVTKV